MRAKFMKRIFRYLIAVCAVTSISYSISAEENFVYWPEADYDPAIPSFSDVLGYVPGEQITWHRDAIRYFEALEAAAPERIALHT